MCNETVCGAAPNEIIIMGGGSDQGCILAWYLLIFLCVLWLIITSLHISCVWLLSVLLVIE